MFRSFYQCQLSFVFGFVFVIAAWFGPLELAKAQSQGSLSAPLDLVSISRIHLEGYLTKSPERLPGPEGFYRASFPCQLLPVPTCGHDQWDLGDCTARAIRSWVFMREITEDLTTGRDVEMGQRRFLLSLLNPVTGLVYVPKLSDKTQGSYLWADAKEENPLGEPAQPTTEKRHVGTYYYGVWDQGRTLRALADWYRLVPEDRDMLTPYIERMITGFDRFATVRGTDPQWGPYAGWRGDTYSNLEPQGVGWVGTVAGIMIEPLVMCAEVMDDPRALNLAVLFTNCTLGGHEADGLPPTTDFTTFRFNPDGSFSNHFHTKTAVLVGIVKLSRYLADHGNTDLAVRYLRRVRTVYEWILSPDNPAHGSRTGWFPDFMYPGHVAKNGEICCVSDMIELAEAMADCWDLSPEFHDWADLHDDVEAFTVNLLSRSQIRLTPEYKELLGQHDISLTNDWTTLHLHRCGAFAPYWGAGTPTLSVIENTNEDAGKETEEDTNGLRHLLWRVHYAGQNVGGSQSAGTRYDTHWLDNPAVDRLVIDKAEREGKSLVFKFRTEDGRIGIDHQLRLGNGATALLSTTLTNTAADDLKDVRFIALANLDFSPDTEDNPTRVDAARHAVITRATEGSGHGAIAALTEPEVLHAGNFENINEAMTAGVLTASDETAFDKTDVGKTEGGKSDGGNDAAGAIQWKIGNLTPGESKTITYLIAVARSETELSQFIQQEELSTTPPEKGPKPTPLDIARRSEGGWPSSYYPNDFVMVKESDGALFYPAAACCGYGGSRGLYAGWRDAMTYSDGELRINFFLKKELPQAVMDTRVPIDGTASIKLKQKARVLIRVPSWLQPDEMELQVAARSVNPARQLDATGHYVDLGQFAKDTIVTAKFPLPERITKEGLAHKNYGGFGPGDVEDQTVYTIHWRGNYVTNVQPRGPYLSFFP